MTKEDHVSSRPVDLIISFISNFALKVRLIGRMKKWENRKDFSLSRLCLVGKVEKWKDGKLLCLVKMKNERIENRVGINLP